MRDYCSGFYTQTERTLADRPSPQPEIRQLDISPSVALVGTILTVDIDCEPSAKIDFAVSNDGLMLVEEQEKRLVFLARRVGNTEINLVIFNPDTLLSSRTMVDVTISTE